MRISCFSLFFLVLAVLSNSCSNEPVFDQIPRVFVEIDVNLNDTDFADLRLDGGYTYILGGYKGIIIYRASGSDYRAFERTSPINPSDPCAIVDVDQSGLFIIDPCSGATFDFEGNPIASSSPVSLLSYITILDDNWLYIRSE